MRRLWSLVAVAFLLALPALPTASADWTGDAEVRNLVVHVNFNERFTVTVVNGGPSPVEVASVAVTIEWEGMPTLYRVFEGSRTVAPGESADFTGPPTRMPNVVTGTYRCFAGVVAMGADGVAVEHRFPATIEAREFALPSGGAPEELTAVALSALVPLSVTAALFRWERTGRWPFFRAVPRWKGHQ